MTVFFTFEREAEKRREPKYGHHGLQNLELTKLLWHKQIQTKIHLHMSAYLCVHVINRHIQSCLIFEFVLIRIVRSSEGKYLPFIYKAMKARCLIIYRTLYIQV